MTVVAAPASRMATAGMANFERMAASFVNWMENNAAHQSPFPPQPRRIVAVAHGVTPYGDFPQSSGATLPANRPAIQSTAVAALAIAARPWPTFGITINRTLLPALQSLPM